LHTNAASFSGARTRAHGVISSPAALREGMPARFDLCSNESGNEAAGISAAASDGRTHDLSDITISTAQLGPQHEPDGLREYATGLALVVRGLALLFKRRARNDRAQEALDRYEFENRTDGGTVQFETFEAPFLAPDHPRWPSAVAAMLRQRACMASQPRSTLRNISPELDVFVRF
jgi:hypothetical protein